MRVVEIPHRLVPIRPRVLLSSLVSNANVLFLFAEHGTVVMSFTGEIFVK